MVVLGILDPSTSVLLVHTIVIMLDVLSALTLTNWLFFFVMPLTLMVTDV